MNRFQDSWRSFRRDNSRKIPLLLTVVFHLGVLLLTLVGPWVMTAKTPRIPEVYTVNLYKVPEAAPPQAAKVVKVVKVTLPPQKTVAPTPEKPAAVSLSPIRQRLHKEREEKEARQRKEELRLSKREQERLERLKAEADKEALQAARDLAAAKKEAVAKIADLYKASENERRDSPPAAVEAPATSPRTGGSDQQQLDAIARYKARLFDHISPHWHLPELQGWDENLRAVLVMQVKRDGTVTNSYFEKRSGNLRFDQYAKKAIDNAQPLPPFPLDIHDKTEEIAVTFSPGGLL